MFEVSEKRRVWFCWILKSNFARCVRESNGVILSSLCCRSTTYWFCARFFVYLLKLLTQCSCFSLLSQRPTHSGSIFRLLLKIAVGLPRSCDSRNFCRASALTITLKRSKNVKIIRMASSSRRSCVVACALLRVVLLDGLKGLMARLFWWFCVAFWTSRRARFSRRVSLYAIFTGCFCLYPCGRGRSAINDA